jgi:hypothetical protein
MTSPFLLFSFLLVIHTIWSCQYYWLSSPSSSCLSSPITVHLVADTWHPINSATHNHTLFTFVFSSCGSFCPLTSPITLLLVILSSSHPLLFRKTNRDLLSLSSSGANTFSILHQPTFGINSTLIYSPISSIKDSSSPCWIITQTPSFLLPEAPRSAPFETIYCINRFHLSSGCKGCAIYQTESCCPFTTFASASWIHHIYHIISSNHQTNLCPALPSPSSIPNYCCSWSPILPAPPSHSTTSMTITIPLAPSEFSAAQNTITMEDGSMKTTICVNTIPVVSAPPLAKSIAFNTLTTALYHTQHSLTPADWINVLITHIPVPAASAEAEANWYTNLFRQQFLQVSNITPKAFLTNSGKISTADPLQIIAGHILHIQYALVESSFNPGLLCHSLMGSHQYTTIFATALHNASANACIEFCLHLPQDNVNPFTTTEDTDSDPDSEPEEVSGHSNANTTLATLPTQEALRPPPVMTAWTTVSSQEWIAMSTEDLHNIIETSLWYNKQMSNQPHPITNIPHSTSGARVSVGIPPSPSILTALSHPGNNHTHATTYRGNFSFTKHQDKFNTLLKLADPCTIISNPNSGTSTLDYKSVQTSINGIISSIHYNLFWELLFSQYVDKARIDINSSEFTNDTIRQIKLLKLQFCHAGKTITLAPDDLYIKYISLTHTLPHDAREWHALLPSMFLDALTPELWSHLCEGINPYTQPIFNALTNKFDQESALLSSVNSQSKLPSLCPLSTKKRKLHLSPCLQTKRPTVRYSKVAHTWGFFSSYLRCFRLQYSNSF